MGIREKRGRRIVERPPDSDDDILEMPAPAQIQSQHEIIDINSDSETRFPCAGRSSSPARTLRELGPPYVLVSFTFLTSTSPRRRRRSCL